MSGYYFLISSLPSLRFEEKPFYGVRQFLDLCEKQLEPSKMRILSSLSIFPEKGRKVRLPKDSLFGKWLDWEVCLRNKLAAIRADMLGRSAKEFIHPRSGADYAEIDHAVNEKFVEAEPLEREKALDMMRWRKLDELEFGHDFDFDILCSYMLRLLIKEKWLRRDAEKGLENFNKTVDKAYPRPKEGGVR